MRIEKIANNLFEDAKKIAKVLSIPKNVFEDVKNEFKNLDNCRVLSESFPKGIFEINGYKNQIDRAINRCCRKFGPQFSVGLRPGSNKMRYLIEIRPTFSELPEDAKAQFKDGKALFQNGPLRNEEVHWSTRLSEEEIPTIETCNDDIMIVSPDIHRNTFYGWKKKN